MPCRCIRGEDDIKQLFRPFGEIGRCFILQNRKARMAFVGFMELSSAERAVEQMNGMRVMGTSKEEPPLQVWVFLAEL